MRVHGKLHRADLAPAEAELFLARWPPASTARRSEQFPPELIMMESAINNRSMELPVDERTGGGSKWAMIC
jgi:hypothetical protein